MNWLVVSAAVRGWEGAPLMWFASGVEEQGIDSNRIEVLIVVYSGGGKKGK
jgi:hypothetical protein